MDPFTRRYGGLGFNRVCRRRTNRGNKRLLHIHEFLKAIYVLSNVQAVH